LTAEVVAKQQLNEPKSNFSPVAFWLEIPDGVQMWSLQISLTNRSAPNKVSEIDVSQQSDGFMR